MHGSSFKSAPYSAVSQYKLIMGWARPSSNYIRQNQSCITDNLDIDGMKIILICPRVVPLLQCECSRLHRLHLGKWTALQIALWCWLAHPLCMETQCIAWSFKLCHSTLRASRGSMRVMKLCDLSANSLWNLPVARNSGIGRFWRSVALKLGPIQHTIPRELILGSEVIQHC